MIHLIDVIGWVGAVITLVAYALLTLQRLASASARYQWMNLVGSTGLAVNSFWNHAYPSVALNIIWMGIGLYALFKLVTSHGTGHA